MPGSMIDLPEGAPDWNLLDFNARVGLSGVRGELSLKACDLIEEMNRFSVRDAVVSHWTAEEFDARMGI